MVGGGEVSTHRVDEQGDELVVGVQAQRRGQVADPLRDEARLLRHVDRVDVRKRGVVAEHFGVHHPDDGLFGLLGRERLGEALLEHGHLMLQDLVLLLLRLTLADALAGGGRRRGAHREGVEREGGERS